MIQKYNKRVSNILNLTDGILGDCLGIQILATFNMKREKIDGALLRKGRLIAEHKFEKLSLEETNKLLNFLGKTEIAEEGMVLADIYNIDSEVFKSNNNKISAILCIQQIKVLHLIQWRVRMCM